MVFGSKGGGSQGLPSARRSECGQAGGVDDLVLGPLMMSLEARQPIRILESDTKA
jgi:hypothetical protein